MFFEIIIALIALFLLVVLHEFGHFILAKKFGVKVEEFGIGYPPRIFGKKIGETIYSLNLIPLGGFVKILGEEGNKEENIKDPRNFNNKPIYQRALIVLGGVIMFWIIAWVLLSVTMLLGSPTIVSDDMNENLINPKVQIVAIAPNSPASDAGIKPGDSIKEISVFEPEFSVYGINKVKNVQELTEKHKGQEIVLLIERGDEVFETKLIPRISPPQGQGSIGIGLARTAIVSYPMSQAIIKGGIETYNFTKATIQGWGMVFSSLFSGNGMPAGVQIMGPIGVFDLFAQMSSLGFVYFLRFTALISIFLALFNILPIPALDGGKLVFLGIEAIRKKPVSQELEQKITGFCFFTLILLMIIVTLKDIQRLF
ncbi:MAG: site-2 protease family protein [Patescibacteria group bacterium]|nr:site-2 protease family protein [Patescibacteria group bacterium]